MKLYAVKDRLIDYFMQPFAAHDDKDVLTAFANLINIGNTNDAIAQAPHHFEIWRIAEVTEQGDIVASKEFLAECSSLIRSSLRGAQLPGSDTRGFAITSRERAPGGTSSATRTGDSAPEATPPTTALAQPEAHTGLAGVPCVPES